MQLRGTDVTNALLFKRQSQLRTSDSQTALGILLTCAAVTRKAECAREKSYQAKGKLTTDCIFIRASFWRGMLAHSVRDEACGAAVK
jgi:hypothetical protein